MCRTLWQRSWLYAIVVDVKSSADYDAWLTEQHELTAKAADAEKASLSASMSKAELMQLG